MSNLIYLNFPVNYIGEYIPSNRQALFWGNQVYQEVDGRKYLLRETSSDYKVKIPFYIYNTDQNKERLNKAENIYHRTDGYPFWKR